MTLLKVSGCPILVIKVEFLENSILNARYDLFYYFMINISKIFLFLLIFESIYCYSCNCCLFVSCVSVCFFFKLSHFLIIGYNNFLLFPNVLSRGQGCGISSKQMLSSNYGLDINICEVPSYAEFLSLFNTCSKTNRYFPKSNIHASFAFVKVLLSFLKGFTSEALRC